MEALVPSWVVYQRESRLVLVIYRPRLQCELSQASQIWQMTWQVTNTAGNLLPLWAEANTFQWQTSLSSLKLNGVKEDPGKAQLLTADGERCHRSLFSNNLLLLSLSAASLSPSASCPLTPVSSAVVGSTSSSMTPPPHSTASPAPPSLGALGLNTGWVFSPQTLFWVIFDIEAS